MTEAKYKDMGRQRKKKYVSVFVKLVIAFIILGFIPLLVVGLIVYNRNIEDVRNSVIENAVQTTRIAKEDISNLLNEIKECSESLYEYETDDYGYFYDVLRNTRLSDILRENLIEDALKMILYSNDSIDHVYFLSKNGSVYSSTKTPEKMIDVEEMQKWTKQYYSDEKNKITIVPTHETPYYLNTDEREFTFIRNIMNTESIKTAGKEVLGTLFIDLKTDGFQEIFDEVDINKNDPYFIMDGQNFDLIFGTYEEDKVKIDIDKLSFNVNMLEEQFCLKLEDGYLIGHMIPDAGWAVVKKVPLSSLERLYSTIIKSTILLVSVSIFLTLILYWYNSRTVAQPIRTLTKAMDEIKGGNLDTYVNISSHDEMELLANGLNSMTEQLKRHIEKVYISEIRQKEAQFGTLLMQIQPHYLYNTLDSIRMSAIAHDDFVTATMLESLSGQMRYLIGDGRTVVNLKEELDNVKNYFVIVGIRYENEISLEIDADKEVLNCKIPRLTLQPLAENAVKYGVAPRGKGIVAIYAKIKQECLDIAVIDDGVGMDEATLARANAILHGTEERCAGENKKFSIGLKNVEDRIKLQFGDKYGIEIVSTQSVGTYVHCKLPVIYVEGDE